MEKLKIDKIRQKYKIDSDRSFLEHINKKKNILMSGEGYQKRSQKTDW